VDTLVLRMRCGGLGGRLEYAFDWPVSREVFEVGVWLAMSFEVLKLSEAGVLRGWFSAIEESGSRGSQSRPD
jgi:hypothetical protein